MKKGNLIFVLMILTLLSLAALTVRYNHQLTLNLRPQMARIDPGILARQLESGNLSSKKADFFQAVGRKGSRITGPHAKILIQESKPSNEAKK
ncbi:MAG: hypothetical protein NT056_06025 [Proteobacteria bacterium]|nr:hypothetical protein [Pseudomonadota bacterium]